MANPDPNMKLVVVLETPNMVLLDLAQAALEEAGIEFAVKEPEPPEFGFTPILNPVFRIFVADRDEPRARQVLEPVVTAEPEEASVEDDTEEESGT